MTVLEDHFATRELDVNTEWLRILNRELNPNARQINTKLLVQTYRYIDEHPREYDQTRWGVHHLFRPNQFCFAGHAAMLAGARPRFKFLGHFGWLLTVTEPNGTSTKVDEYAQDALGLSRHQSDVLFSEFASKRLIRDSIRAWTGVDPA